MRRNSLKSKILALTFIAITVFSNDIFAMSKARSVYNTVKTKVVSFIQNEIGTYSECASCRSVWSPNTTSNYSPIEYPRIYDRTTSSTNPLWQNKPKGQLWTQYTLEAIDREGLANITPKDAAVYCPNFSNLTQMERRSFWLNFAAKLAYHESGYDSTCSFKEPQGMNSNGLFQMSKGDACGVFKSEMDTFDDKKNIDCAIITMRMYLQKSPYIGTDYNVGLGRYWQPLKDHPSSYIAQTKKNKASILKYTRSLPYCQL